MTAEAVLFTLARINLVAGGAVLLVLLLRPLVLRRLGAKAAYRLWLVAPIAAAACLLPARLVAPPPQPFEYTPFGETAAVVVDDAPNVAGAPTVRADGARPSPAPNGALATALLVAWLLGATGLLARSIASTRRLARDPAIGPALIGVLRPRLVLPADFDTRFDAQERALILAHEDVHRASGHTLVNAIIELARCVSWFNPLAHVAAVRIRADQELACDAAVLAAHPTERRAYAEALLKTHIASAYLPLGCTWPSRTSRRLEERIIMMTCPAPGRWTGLASAASLAILGLASGVAAWAAQPARVALPEAKWTPSAEAPEGLLTELEAQRHDLFIDLARSAASCPGSPRSACRDGEGVDFVLFGATAAEMWWWPARGMDVWEGAFASRKGVNFGSQGTRPASLLWRMRNGELDGYDAKLVVLYALAPATGDNRIPDEQRAAVVADTAPIIAEIRARQPHAKILIVARFPRGELRLEPWRAVSAANAEAYAPLVDNETVFYTDIGERFFLPDGSHDQSMWSQGLANRGIQAPAYEAWADELELWLERFVD